MPLRDRVRHHLADTTPLENRHFRRLWTANIVTVVGAQLTVVSIPAQIYADTGSSAYVGLTGIFGLVPLVVFGLWGGALADHLDRRTLLLVTTSGLIATSAVLCALAASGTTDVWALLSVFAVQQAFFAVNQPTRSALLPSLLPTPQLAAANALNTTVMSAGAIAGPLVAGALIPVTGFTWLYAVDTVTLFATLYAVVKLPPLPAPRAAAGEVGGGGVGGGRKVAGVRSVLEGLTYLRGQPVLLMSFVVDVIAMVFGMPRALFPELAHVAFGGPVDGGVAFAVLFAAIPAGAVLGGILSGWVSRVSRQGLAVIWSIVVWGVAMLGFGLATLLAPSRPGPMLVAAAAMLVVGGAADMASAAFRMAMLQTASSEDVRGRLQGVFIVVVAGGPRVADVAHGAAAAAVGAGAAAAGGGVLVVLGVAAAALAVPAFVRYRVTAAYTR